jgi:hypothetical protein
VQPAVDPILSAASEEVLVRHDVRFVQRADVPVRLAPVDDAGVPAAHPATVVADA